MSITAKIINAINAPTYEPQKRMFEGRYTWAKHRFPIKNGITLREAMIRDMYYGDNTWLELFKNTNKAMGKND